MEFTEGERVALTAASINQFREEVVLLASEPSLKALHEFRGTVLDQTGATICIVQWDDVGEYFAHPNNLRRIF
jgi:hypothetical protein